MSFLPADFKFRDKSSQFMKLEKGDNKIRILSDAITGAVWWEGDTGERKPFRVKTFQEAVANPGAENPKEFIAFVVWNYQSNSVQVLEITQKTIMRAIHELSIDSDWGHPRGYDIVIKRSGDGLETEYSVQPKPAKEAEKTILDAYKASQIDLNRMFDGEYPMPTPDDDLDVDPITEGDLDMDDDMPPF